MTPVLRHAPLLFFPLAALMLACTNPVDVEAKSTGKFQPTAEQQRASQEVQALVRQVHYKKMNLNDELSQKLYARYLEVLDPNRSYLYQKDIDSLNRYANHFDDALRKGDLTAAFAMYNLFQDRIEARLAQVNATIEKQLDALDFSKDERYLIDRSEQPWITTPEAMDELWRKRIKYLALQLKLQGKTDTEIKETLSKRFKNLEARTKQTNREDAFQTYMNAFTHVYDPHTTYFTPRESENFDINMSLQLQGIGAVLQTEDEYTKVVRLVTGGPADKAGQLKPADKIVGVGQGKQDIQDVVGWRLDEVVDLIRGKKGTIVRLEILPADDDSVSKTISIKRDTVKLEDRAAQAATITVATKTGNKTYGIISLPAFYHDFQGMQKGDPNYRSSTRDLKRLITELQQRNIDGLIVDLRNNGGGSLQEAQKAVGLFIPIGPVVQVKSYKGIESLGDTDPTVFYNGPLAVVVNRLSASASEIFAGAIQDYNRGIVVGERTFGKGTVQSLQDLDHGKLKITLAKFYRISGESNQHQGIMPDISYPSLFDFTEIGESALDNALPADSIKPSRYNKGPSLTGFIPELTQRHQARIKSDPEFNYVEEQIVLREDLDSKKTVSLNEKTRKLEIADVEQQRLDSENRKRKALGEKTFADMEELRDFTEKENQARSENKKLEVDYILEETADILNDFIELSTPQNSAKRALQATK